MGADESKVPTSVNDSGRHLRGPLLRVGAAGVDAAAALVLTRLLATTTGHYFATRAETTFRIGAPDSRWKGPLPMILGMISPISYGFAFALVVVLLSEALFAVSPGKLTTNSVISSADGAAPTATRRWVRFTIKAGGAWMFCLALVVGVEALVWCSAVWGMVVAVGFAGAFTDSRGALHDRMAWTRVVKRA